MCCQGGKQEENGLGVDKEMGVMEELIGTQNKQEFL